MTLVVSWCREKVELARGLSLELVIDRGKAGPYRYGYSTAIPAHYHSQVTWASRAHTGYTPIPAHYHRHVTGARQARTGTEQQYQHTIIVM